MAVLDTLSPNGDDSGWPTGTFSDIIADGGGVMSTTVDNDVLIIDLDPSVVVDGDTVTSVDVVIRGRSTGSGGKDQFLVDLLIGGSAQGTQFNTGNLTGSHADYPITGTTQTWTGDYTEVQCDGMQIQVQANQTGKATAATWEVDTITVTVNGTAAASGTEIIIPAAQLQISTTAPVLACGGNAAVRFDGTDDTITVGDFHDFASNAPFTVEFWINADASQPGGSFVRVISKEGATDGWDIELDVVATNIRTLRKDSGGGDGSTDGYTAATIFHYAGVYDGTDIQGFVDGSGGTKVASSRSLPGNTATLSFGEPSGASSNEFAGVLDEIRIWDYARTSAEINRDKDIRLQGSEDGLVGYWRLNTGSGTTATDDGSGGNDGTFEANPVWVWSMPVLTGDGIEIPAAQLQFSTTIPTISIDAVGGDVAIEIPAANLEVSTAALSLDIGFVPAAAQLEVSAAAPLLSQGYVRTPPAAQLQLSATAPALSQGLVRTPPAAQLELSATAPDIATPIGITIPAGQLQISTTAPAVTFGFSIEIPAAQIEISTTAPSLLTPVGVEIPAANVQLSTTAPLLSQGFRLTPPAAQLELSSTAPTINFGFSLGIPAANLQLSTTAPTVAVTNNVSIEIPAAQLVLSTTAPAVNFAFAIEPPAANLELSSTAPAIVIASTGVSIEIPAANLQVSTSVPSIAIDRAFTIPAANLQLSSSALSIAIDRTIEIPAAQLTLSTTAPTVLTPISIDIPAAQLTLSTSAPGLSLGIRRQPPAANIQVTTAAPVLLLGINIEPPAAQIEFSTAAPSINFEFGIEIPAANLTLSGFAPDVLVRALFQHPDPYTPRVGYVAQALRESRTITVANESRAALVARDDRAA